VGPAGGGATDGASSHSILAIVFEYSTRGAQSQELRRPVLTKPRSVSPQGSEWGPFRPQNRTERARRRKTSSDNGPLRAAQKQRGVSSQGLKWGATLLCEPRRERAARERARRSRPAARHPLRPGPRRPCSAQGGRTSLSRPVAQWVGRECAERSLTLSLSPGAGLVQQVESGLGPDRTQFRTKLRSWQECGHAGAGSASAARRAGATARWYPPTVFFDLPSTRAVAGLARQVARRDSTGVASPTCRWSEKFGCPWA
jgi:hypothetical protein